jgi:unsaturated rhamnogalacturonyl hydrolase
MMTEITTLQPMQTSERTAVAAREVAGRLADRTRRYDFTVWFWGDAIAVDGLLQVADALGQEESISHVEQSLRRWIAAPRSWTDHLTPGCALLDLYRRTADEVFLAASIELATYLTQQVPRTPDRLPMYRPDLPPYRHCAWVDTLYHEPPFFARLAAVTGDAEWIDAAEELCNAHIAVLSTESSPILAHSYDAGAELARGFGWARGNGWATLGLIDTLEALPAGHPAAERLRLVAQRLCSAVLPLQDVSGFWHTLIEDRDAYLESSTAAFFGATFAKGVRQGVLGDEYREAADRAWRAMVSRIDSDGSFWGVSACTYASVHPDDDIQMYKTLPTEVNVWGQGAALRFAGERLIDAGEGAA